MGEFVAIVGSKDFADAKLVRDYVAMLAPGTTVVSGGARGVDSYAEEAARKAGLATLIFHADWENLGRSAGPVRNEKIIARASRVVAFWSGESRGTLNSLVLAHELDLPVEIFDDSGNPVSLAHALDVAREKGVFDSIKRGRERAARADRSR